MVGPDSGENQPLKLAGYALLAVAAIAAIVGLITLASGGSDSATADPSAQAAPPSSETPPPSPAPLPAPAPAAPPAAAGPTAAPSSAAPVLPGAGLPSNDTSDKKGSGSGSGSGVTKAPVRVYNNSKITGLAERAADDMRDSGWKVTSVDNYPESNGVIGTSTVYYRPGTSEDAAARSLANSFGLRAEPRFAGIKDATAGLIVIVTNDYQRR